MPTKPNKRGRDRESTDKEFQIMIVKMIQNLGKRMEVKIEKMKEMFTKDLEELKNKQK